MDISAYPQEIQDLIIKASDNTNPNREEIIKYCDEVGGYAKKNDDVYTIEKKLEKKRN